MSIAVAVKILDELPGELDEMLKDAGTLTLPEAVEFSRALDRCRRAILEREDLAERLLERFPDYELRRDYAGRSTVPRHEFDEHRTTSRLEDERERFTEWYKANS